MSVLEPAAVEQVLGRLEAALRDAGDVAWGCQSKADLRMAVDAIPRLRNRVDALAGEIIDRAFSSGALATRRPEHYLGAETNESPAEVRADMAAVRWLRDFAEIAAAYTNGVISRRHIDLLRKADSTVTHRAMVSDQTDLVVMARDCTFAGFQTALQYWVNAVDPDGTIADDQVRGNDIRISRHIDGSCTLKGRLDPLLGTAVHNAIEAETQKLRRDDDENGRARTTAQRRAHAFAGLVAKGAARNNGTFATPLINIVMSETVAEKLLASYNNPDRDLGLDADSVDGRCEFIDGTPLHPKLALAVLGVANLRRVILDAKSRPIDISHNARNFPQWMKHAALISTRGSCTETGCDAQYHWLHADHHQPHSKGGPTRLNNLQPLCSTANKAKNDTWPPKTPNTTKHKPAA